MGNMKGKVVLTGATGFIGSNLVALLASSYEVVAVDVAMDRLEALKEQYNVSVLCKSFEDYGQLHEEIQSADYFIHLAWAGVSGKSYNLLSAQMNNIEASCEALMQAVQLGCKKFVFIDSSHEHQKNINSKGEEGYASLYGAAKKAARSLLETMAHNNGIDFCGVAFTNVYGYGDYSERSTNLILQSLAKNNEANLIDGVHKHDWTYVSDAVAGIQAVMEQGKNNRVYYVGSRTLLSFREIIETLAVAYFPDAKLNFGKYMDTAFIDYSGFDLELLYRDTGYTCSVSLLDGVGKTLEWLKQIGRI